jgi:hypothetical protein
VSIETSHRVIRAARSVHTSDDPSIRVLPSYLPTLAGLAAAGLVLLGCGRQEPTAANRAESDAIMGRLSELPGVVRSEGGYAFNASDPGSVSVLIEARAGSDLDRLADQAVGIVWRSKLDPIESVIVRVIRNEQPAGTVLRDADFAMQKRELTRRYGPRAVE